MDEWTRTLETTSWIGMIKHGGRPYVDDEEIEWQDTSVRYICSIEALRTFDPEVLDLLPSEYHEFAKVFSKEAQDALPEHGPHDMHLELQPGKTPPSSRLYPLSRDELDLLREYIAEMVRTGKIRPSKSSAGAPIFFAKQPSGKLRIVVDYRGLNAITIKDKYPIPLMTTLVEQVSGSKIYTKLDLKAGFNLLRIAAGDEWKTAFTSRYGLYEYLVMPFGLSNAPSVFQRYVNDILKERLDKGVNVYIDDIMIHTETMEEHVVLVRWVLQKLTENNLCVNPKKCVFHVLEVEFCSYTIGQRGVKMSEDKVQEIVNWRLPRNVVEVQSFLGFANFYRRFIKGFAKVTRPLTDLTRTGITWNWNEACTNAFEGLKKLFTEAPILAHFDPDRPKIIKTDASDLAIGGILSQLEPDVKWHPIAFISRKFQAAEVNYDVHDKEMVAIIYCFKEWRHFLIGCPHKIVVYTDHKNLEYFNSTKILNQRQARWAEILSEFDFTIVYRPGEKNGKADALSRRLDPELERGDRNANLILTLFKPGQLQLNPNERVIVERNDLIVAALSVEESKWKKQIWEAGESDSKWKSIQKTLILGQKTDEGYELEDNLVTYRRRLYIPDDNGLKLEVARECHDSKVAGHFGRDKTYELMKRDYHWPDMEAWIRNYVKTCVTCQRNKTPRHAKHGLLRPLDIPYAPWEGISMDFITDLLEVKGYCKIWVIVDRFSKMAHFIPLKRITA